MQAVLYQFKSWITDLRYWTTTSKKPYNFKMTSLLSDSPYCTIVHWPVANFELQNPHPRNSDLHTFDSAALWIITCSRIAMRDRIIFEFMPSKWRFMMALCPSFSFAMLSI
jgi:hypothetical protein